MLWFVLILFTHTTFGSRPTVIIKDGSLAGIQMQTWMGRNISAFLGIPFAAPPTNGNRFLPPQPAAAWSGIRNAASMGPICIQYTGNSSAEIIGNEDCLYLNVYTPILPWNGRNVSFPVLVYMHPGGYMMGTGNVFGPRYLLDYNLVLVTFNYRLGILGFLSTEDSVVPGNMGLKDQVAVLRWVQLNIQAFGGNPQEVTIAGPSSGAASVQLHYLSRVSRGLFKRGICLSGSSLMPLATMRAPIYKNTRVAKALNCPYSSSSILVNCLRRIPAAELVFQESILQYFYYTPVQVFGPTVERGGSQPFITRLPYEILRTGDIKDAPILFSSVTQEGLVPVAFFITNTTGISYLSENWLEVFPYLLDYIYTTTSANRNATSTKIYQYYFGNQPISLATNQTLIKMVGDREFVNDIETAARIQAFVQSSPVYFYRFSYRGQYSVTDFITGTNINFGVAHTDDTLYLSNNPYFPPSENTPSDRAMITVMSGLWASFVIQGIPRAGQYTNWQPINRKTAMTGPFNYLMIASPSSIALNQTITFGHPQFWDNLPLNEPQSGRPTYSL
ncbi:carboxylic ester hydrolase [Halyomorpha halys]|uniref:carboxylic ester hydrolase n=1 Tax=Halyomorpha halys TaxID=286706 RepID=UPI0006D51884|nr:esterase E4 [Halyomorpha halys]